MPNGINAWRDDKPEPHFHEVENVAGATNKKQLHHEVVQGNPGPQQVHVASDEHHNIQKLGFEREAWSGSSARSGNVLGT